MGIALKRFVIIMFFYCSVCIADDYPYVLGIEGDKVLHFGTSTIIATTTYALLTVVSGRQPNLRGKALIGASVMALGVGLAKEVIDANGKSLDGKDLLADALGVAFASTLIYYIDVRHSDRQAIKIKWLGNKVYLGYNW